MFFGKPKHYIAAQSTEYEKGMQRMPLSKTAGNVNKNKQKGKTGQGNRLQVLAAFKTPSKLIEERMIHGLAGGVF